MPGFVGEDIAARLDYKLSTGATGRVPQPTAAEARKYRDVVREAQCRITGLTLDEAEAAPADGEIDELTKRLDLMTSTQRDELSDATIEATIEICKGHPSRDEITALGGLEQVAFCNWLLGELSPLF